jgi:Type VI secretion system/phage-baseplate injector OB domain
MFEMVTSHSQKMYGKYSGVVTKNDTDTNNTGIVMVQIPSVFGTAEVPARPCMPYGHFFVPAVGTNVWVEFEAGDPGYPIYVGCWYPNGATPPPAAISPPDDRVIQTASGHTIEIMDKAGDEKITIKHKGNAFLNIDKDGSILIANQTGSYIQLDAKNNSATVVEQHGNLINMDNSGVSITEKSGKTVIQMTDDTVVLMGSSIILQAPSVSLTGAASAMPTILAAPSFVSMFNAFMLHTHATAVGPSGPPLPPGPLLTPGSTLSSGTVVA